MNIDNFQVIPYLHIESGEAYTLICVTNGTAQSKPGEENKWPMQAVYRKVSTGEIFSRDVNQFMEKFTMNFSDLEKQINLDLDELEKIGALSPSFFRRKIIFSIRAFAKNLWTLFPMLSDEVKIKAVRSLTLGEFFDKIDRNQFEEIFGTELTVRAEMFSNHFNSIEDGKTVSFNPGEDEILLIIVGVVQAYIAYLLAVTQNVEVSDEAEEQKHLANLDEMVKDLNHDIEWLCSIDVRVAKPDLSIRKINFVNSKEAATVVELLPN